MWAALTVLGLIILWKSRSNSLWKSRSNSAVMMAMIIAIITGSFAAGRLLGLAFDGVDAGSGLTYYEIGFELVWMCLGLFLTKRAIKRGV